MPTVAHISSRSIGKRDRAHYAGQAHTYKPFAVAAVGTWPPEWDSDAAKRAHSARQVYSSPAACRPSWRQAGWLAGLQAPKLPYERPAEEFRHQGGGLAGDGPQTWDGLVQLLDVAAAMPLHVENMIARRLSSLWLPLPRR